MKKFIIINTQEAHHTSAYIADGEDDMLESVEGTPLEYIEVWEIAEKVKLVNRSSVVIDAVELKET